MHRSTVFFALWLAACGTTGASPTANVVADVVAADWFAPGTPSLSPAGQTRLRELAAGLRGHKTVVEVIEIDPLQVARLPTNRNLGVKRGQATRQFLVEACGLAPTDVGLAQVRATDHEEREDRIRLRIVR